MAGGFQAGATNTDYPALTVEAANSIIHQYTSIETGIAGQSPLPPTGYVNRAANVTGGGVRYNVSTSGVPAASRAAINNIDHTVTSGNSGSIYTHAVEIRGATAAQPSTVPAAIASGKWSVREVTDPAEATTAGFEGKSGRLFFDLADDVVLSVTNDTGTYVLVFAPWGTLSAAATVVTAAMRDDGFYTASGKAVATSWSPALGWRRGEGDEAELFPAGTKGPITIAGLSGGTGDPTGPVTEVSTVTALVSAVKAAALGDVIEVAPGNYALGSLSTNSLKGIKKSSLRTELDNKAKYVWIRPKDRANPPKFTDTMNLTDSTGLWIDGLHFDGRSKKDTEGDPRRCNAQGQLLGAVYYTNIVSENYPSGEAVASPDAKGIQFDGGSAARITITNCLFQFHHRGIEFRSTGGANDVHNDIRVIGNEFVEQGMDCVNFFRSFDKCVAERNLFHKSHIDYNRTTEMSLNSSNKVVENRHADQMVQFALTFAGDGTKDCVIRFNWSEITQRSANGGKIPDAHGFLTGTPNIKSGATFSADVSHNNMLVDNNYIMCPDTNGISLQGMRNSTISRNWMRRTPGLNSYDGARPCIRINGPSHDGLVISNNVGDQLTAFGTGKVDGVPDATRAKVTITGDVASQADTPKPTGWIDLTKTNSALTSSAFKSGHAAPSGNVGRYRVGWNS